MLRLSSWPSSGSKPTRKRLPGGSAGRLRRVRRRENPTLDFLVPATGHVLGRPPLGCLLRPAPGRWVGGAVGSGLCGRGCDMTLEETKVILVCLVFWELLAVPVAIGKLIVRKVGGEDGPDTREPR